MLVVKISHNLGKHDEGVLLPLAILRKRTWAHTGVYTLSCYAPTFVACSSPFNKRAWRSSDVRFAGISSSLVCCRAIYCVSTPSVIWPPRCWLVYYQMCTRTHALMEKESCWWDGRVSACEDVYELQLIAGANVPDRTHVAQTEVPSLAHEQPDHSRYLYEQSFGAYDGWKLFCSPLRLAPGRPGEPESVNMTHGNEAG